MKDGDLFLQRQQLRYAKQSLIKYFLYDVCMPLPKLEPVDFDSDHPISMPFIIQKGVTNLKNRLN
jgi:hypothetical protein